MFWQLLTTALACFTFAADGNPCQCLPWLRNSDLDIRFDLTAHLNRLLAHPRIPGTPEHASIVRYLNKTLSEAGLRVQLQVGTLQIGGGSAAGKRLQFTNVIASTPNPFNIPSLVLAAHYDTLQLGHPNKPFIGATDSAASVAILLSLAKMLAVKHCVNHPVSIILFDGEEAFHQWTSDDSVYGSRILAAEWSRTCLPLHRPFSPPAHQTEMTSMKTRLNLIRQLILLDLLGSRDPWPTIHNLHYSSTASTAARLGFEAMARIEGLMVKARLLSPSRQRNGRRYLIPAAQDREFLRNPPGIDDDHRPLMEAGLRDILHLIPVPFPSVWHTIADDRTALDMDIIRDFVRIIYGYVELYISGVY